MAKPFVVAPGSPRERCLLRRKEDHPGMKSFERKQMVREAIEKVVRERCAGRRDDDWDDEDDEDDEEDDDDEEGEGDDQGADEGDDQGADEGEYDDEDGEPEVQRPLIPRPDGAPYWVPEGSMWNEIPEGTRIAVRDILEPAYRRLVLEAGDELERSAGLTLVHLLWLEICDQTRLGLMAGDRKSVFALVEDPDEVIAHHLRLVTAKNSSAELLLKLRMTREMLKRGERLWGPPGDGLAIPPPVPPGPAHAPLDPSGYRIVPDLPPPPEMCCGLEGPEIGKS